MLTRRRALVAVFGAGLTLLAGCSSSSKPGMVDLTINAAPDINPNAEGRPSPVVLRVYQLAAGGQFQAADFFQLVDKESATLGPDLVERKELELAPGTSQKLTLPLKPNTQLIAVAASFRDIDRAKWRAMVEVPPDKTTKLTADVKKLEVTLAKSS